MRHTPAAMSAHLQAQAEGSATVAAYCAAHDLKVATFYYWRKKLAAGRSAEPELVGFTELKPAAESPQPTLHLPNGLCVELSGLSMAQIADLIVAIDQQYA